MQAEAKNFNIILLKTSDSTTDGQAKDRYIDYLESNNTNSLFQEIIQINLLTFDYCNLESLNRKLKECFLVSNKNEFETYLRTSYRCLIITSRQTIESIELAFKNQLETIEDNYSNSQLDESSLTNEINIENKFIVYCVGQATLARFKDLIKKFKQINSVIDQYLLLRTVGSDNKQNAIELSRVIKQDYNEFFKNKIDESSNGVFALYPCSSIRKDDLSNELAKSSISYDELIAYKTVNSIEGLNSLEDALTDYFKITEHRLNFLVFFSPSGVEGVFSHLPLCNLIKENLGKIKLLSIGPSTSAKLNICLKTICNQNDSLLFELDEPSPQALLKKLKTFL